MLDRPPETDSVPSAAGAVRTGLGDRWWWVAVLLLSAVPSFWTLDAPLVAEDAGILRSVHHDGALADWTGPQYGLHLLAFWRPLVTTSWSLQEALTGVDPGPLRAFNLLCHAFAAVGVGLLVRRLGASGLGALVAGGLAALFPEQGGTVTWIAGRTDGMVALLMVFACLAMLHRRPVATFLLAFLACATKEMAFMLPFWAVLLLGARGGLRAEWRPAVVRGLAPLVLAVGVAFLWRRLALGMWVGGYLASPGGGLLEAAPQAGLGWLKMSSTTLFGVAVAFVLGAMAGTWRPRLALAGLGCAVFGAAPLLPILGEGVLSEQNIRLLRVSDLGLCLAAAGAFASVAGARRRLLALPPLALLLLGGVRGGQALLDTHEWAEAGRVAEAAVQRARDEVAAEAPGDLPVLYDGLPPVYGGAYCLGIGAADRFRAPFPVSPRPVWPLRPLFVGDANQRPPVAPLRDGFVRPEERVVGVARIEVSVDGQAAFRAIAVDERAAPQGADTSPRLEIHGSFPDAWLEFVLYTDQGYEPAPWRAAGAAELHSLTVRELCGLSENVVAPPSAVLYQAADFGGTRAYLEVRAVRMSDGAVVAASPFLALEWDEDLLDRLDG